MLEVSLIVILDTKLSFFQQLVLLLVSILSQYSLKRSLFNSINHQLGYKEFLFFLFLSWNSVRCLYDEVEFEQKIRKQ